MSFWNRRKQSRRAAAATLDALEPRRLLAFEVGMGGAWSPAAIDEGGGVATFHVDRYDYDTGDYSQPLTVNLAVRGWDQGGASPASADDLAFPATATFAPGEWQTSFDVTAVDDLLPEPDEPYEMYVLPGGGYTTDPAWSRQSAVFESDVPNVWVEAAGQPATEGGAGGQLTFRRDNTRGSLTVRFLPWDDTAYVDEVTFPGAARDAEGFYLATFADGQAAVTVATAAVDDAYVEPTEQVRVQLYDDGGYAPAGGGKYFTPGDPGRPSSVMASIADDDVNLTFESPYVTVGSVRQATVTALDHDGNPVAGKTISVGIDDLDTPSTPDLAAVDATVTTGADGTAVVNLRGLAEGQADVVLRPNGAAGPAFAFAAQAKNPILKSADAWVVVGGGIGHYVKLTELQGAAQLPKGLADRELTVTAAKVNNADIVTPTVRPPGKTDQDGDAIIDYRGLAKGQTRVTIRDVNSGVFIQVNVTVEDPIIRVTIPPVAVGQAVRIDVRVFNSRNDPMSGVALVLTDAPAIFALDDKDGLTTGATDPKFNAGLEGKGVGTANLKVRAVASGIESPFAVTVK